MFDIGFFELVLIFVICLVVLGPERLPSVARTLGHWTGRARNAFNNLRYELESEAHNRDMQAKFRDKLEELGINEDMLSGGKPPADNQILPGERTGDENRDDDAK